MRTNLPQRCSVGVVYVTWAAYAVGILVPALTGRYALMLSWAVALPLAIWAYVRVFPRISSSLGYGSVADRRAGEAEWSASPARVRLYTGVGCPFCPIVESRLRTLQARLGFELEVVDVTVRPDVAAREHIAAVPVVEADGRRRAGCATTDELAAFLAGRPLAAVVVGAAS